MNCARCVSAATAIVLLAGSANAGIVPGFGDRGVHAQLGSAAPTVQETADFGDWDATANAIVSVDVATASQKSLIDGNEVSGELFASVGVFNVSPMGSAVSEFVYSFRLTEVTDFLLEADADSGNTPGFDPRIRLTGPQGVLIEDDVEAADSVFVDATLFPGVYTFEARVGGSEDRPGGFSAGLDFSLILETKVIVPAPATGIAMLGMGGLAMRRRRSA
ncbi:MAG: PEP-CTERM sorting domain-containing protein [Planctomycetota bacterium]